MTTKETAHKADACPAVRKGIELNAGEEAVVKSTYCYVRSPRSKLTIYAEGCLIRVETGGPDVWIDTASKTVSFAFKKPGSRKTSLKEIKFPKED
jgi:hypothetical protein